MADCFLSADPSLETRVTGNSDLKQIKVTKKSCETLIRFMFCVEGRGILGD